jgi:N-acyl-D-aspartate/D-glutamate deacylase
MVVVKARRVIDGTGRPPIEHAAVIVDGLSPQ